ncbi:glutathione reductase [Thiohalorhabdus denitrificans]|uniref:NADPH-glutathione reductase n=1 Tax=Thiohalorhabdus denitrificans TaxID=381306 RepID=A0A0P9EAB6_9GAMM|nr:glutathione-disulfide reductase [Thiohalorhabdus denitrificans]KPV39282.1 glutathione reductase [Thiohalorhabdus denitrificans]SCX76951.1 NADPH-glutathione reductase [Thiohalorhabdus denitrificans]
MARHYDFLVLGGGSGGLAAAKRAAGHGARTALVEPHPLGGTCVNVGCVPKKVMWNAAGIAEALEDAPGYGFEVEGARFHWDRLRAARAAYVERLNGIHRRNLEVAEVEHLAGYGRFVDAGTVEVDGTTYTADRILIATGGRPRVPNLPGAEHGLTSDGFFELAEQPRRVAIVGAGYIAVELAGVLNALGSEVTMLLRREHLLGGFDALMRETLMDAMSTAGVNFLTCIHMDRVERGDDGYVLVSADGDRTGDFDQVVWAVGRDASTEGLGLEAAGVETGPEGIVPVDEWQDTNIPGVHAVGDVTGRAPLTPVAIAAGRRLADRLFGGQADARLDYADIPSVVFSHPPIGTVGLTEEEAEERYGQGGFACHTTTFKDMYYAPLDRKEPTAMKVITVGPHEKLAGIHVIGRGADEMIQGFAATLKAGGTLQTLRDTVAIHPTAAEELVLIG